MARNLDEHALETYCRRLGFFKEETQKIITRIHASKSRGDLYHIRGSTCIGYPSKKMGGIIRAESRMVEFPSILEFEYRTECEEAF